MALKSNESCFCGSGQKFKRCHRRAFDPVRPGRLSPMRAVPDHIEKPTWADTGVPNKWDEDPVKSHEIVDRMRRTGLLAAEILAELAAAVKPGVTTDQLDELCHDLAVRADSYPSPLNYKHFPKSLCTSVNEVICHGIPDDRPLVDGDIVNLDVTVWREGVHGDTNATFPVGVVDERSRQLITVARESLELGVEAARAGSRFSDIGRAIQTHAEGEGFGVVRDFVGHGIGEQFHTEIQVPHYYNPGDDRNNRTGHDLHGRADDHGWFLSTQDLG